MSGRNISWPKLRYYTKNFLEELRGNTKILKISGLRIGI
jgi:hypothetical protein